MSLAPLRNSPQLKLEVSAWARMASVRDIQYEQIQINTKLPFSWETRVCHAFSEALESSLRDRGANVVKPPSSKSEPMPSGVSEIVVNAFLTAGFVYKTWTSSTYAPFVHVVLEAKTLAGSPLYHRLLIASNRPFNPLMTNIPAEDQYLLEDIESLDRHSELAVNSLVALAVQLARRFAAELVA